MSAFTIVIVEDDADEAALLCDLLAKRGYRCVAVASGDQCLDHVAREPVDLVITGIHMPGISGVDLCATLNAQYPHLPVIVLSGIAHRAARGRAFAHMMKPVKLEALEGAIRRALRPTEESGDA